MSVGPTIAALVLAATILLPQAAFRSGVQTVAVYATVSERDGRLVPDLTREDFRVFDNGQPVEITAFSNDPQPVTVAVMLDMSGSMERRFLRVRESTFKFIEAMRPDDRAAIGTFGAEISISPMVTGDHAVLKRVVEEEVWPGGGTPLWNAIEVAMSAIAGEPGRRVILVLTDGADTGSIAGHRADEGDVARRARKDAFMIYAVGMEGSGLSGAMSGLARETGGGAFELRRDADLTATFERVAEELRHQYMLGFTPTRLDGKDHRLEVRMTSPTHTVRARQSYRAEDR
jgi:Ca-activated chloride channel family protein